MSAIIISGSKIYWKLDGETDDQELKMPKPSKQEIQTKKILRGPIDSTPPSWSWCGLLPS